jgi:hypothetical protein
MANQLRRCFSQDRFRKGRQVLPEGALFRCGDIRSINALAYQVPHGVGVEADDNGTQNGGEAAVIFQKVEAAGGDPCQAEVV